MISRLRGRNSKIAMVPLKVIPLGTFSQNMSEIGSLVCAVRGGCRVFMAGGGSGDAGGEGGGDGGAGSNGAVKGGV